MHFVPTRCKACRRSVLVSADAVVNGAALCKICGSQMPLIAGVTYDWLGAQHFCEIDAALSRASLLPTTARSLAQALVSATSTDASLQRALREAVTSIGSVAVVRASTSADTTFRMQVASTLIIQLHAIAAEATFEG